MAAPRSAPTTASSPRTRAARATAASSSGWAATTRCSRARTPTASCSTRSASATGWARAPRSATASPASWTRPASCRAPPPSRHRQACGRARGQEGRGRAGGLSRLAGDGGQRRWCAWPRSALPMGCAVPSGSGASPSCRRASPPMAPSVTRLGKPLFALRVIAAAKGGVIVTAPGIADRDAAEALRGLRLYVPRARLPATDEDEFYHEDLVGLAARATGRGLARPRGRRAQSRCRRHPRGRARRRRRTELSRSRARPCPRSISPPARSMVGAAVEVA